MHIATKKPALSCRTLKKSFELFPVFDRVSFALAQGEKVGLVGVNGSGKSTLLKIVAGLEKQDEGTVTIAPGLMVGYIPQNFELHHGETVEAFLGKKVADVSALASTLARLELPTTILLRTLSTLSGGEKTKVALARMLLAPYNLFLLDEPTNNLDSAALALLEEFVQKSGKTFLIVSHDREFLDHTVEQVIELDEATKTSRIYDGNFSDYRKEREANIERQWAQYKDQVGHEKALKADVANKLEWAEKLKAKRATIKHLPMHEKEKPDNTYLRDREAKMSKRMKVAKNRLERTIEAQEIEKPKEFLPLRLRFPLVARSGDSVFVAEALEKQQGSLHLGPLDLRVQYGEKVLITGANGTGKTTLIKLLLGELKPDAGSVKKGAALKIGYLPQEETLHSERTLLEEFEHHVKLEESLARMHLNRFRIAADDVHKKLELLSMGERSRLKLAIMMAQEPNCLILDEPSNHLDLEALESLEEALHEFEGTLIVVSHDRYFIKKIGFTKTYQLANGVLSATD